MNSYSENKFTEKDFSIILANEFVHFFPSTARLYFVIYYVIPFTKKY